MSFPVIHELRGEFAPFYYELRAALAAAGTRAALLELEEQLRRAESTLLDREFKKLRLLITRRWKAL